MRDKVEAELGCKFAYFGGAGGNVNNNSRIESEKITKDVYEHGNALAQYAIEANPNFTKMEMGNVQLVHRDHIPELPSGNTPAAMDINAFSIGEIAFITAPYEMFDNNGKAIKDASPFAMTFVCTNSNQNRGYIPSEDAFAYNSYEVQNTSFVKGTAEKLQAAYIEMLQELHKTWK